MNYKVGDTVSFEPNGGGIETGVITLKDDDIKNGRPGFDIKKIDGEMMWGYDYQIKAVYPA
jgi:hypothetical protein